MGKLSVTVVGDKELREAVRRGEGAAGDLRPAYERIVDDFHEVMRQAFHLGGRPRRWAPNAPRYARSKRGGVLVDTGDLMRSLTARTHRHSLVRSRPRRLEVGTSVPHARILERGRRGKQRIPPRMFLAAVTPRVRRRWSQLIADQIGDSMAPGAQVRLTQRRRRRGGTRRR